MNELTRELAEGILQFVTPGGHRMDCAAMPWFPTGDGGRQLVGDPKDELCNCDLKPERDQRQRLRDLAELYLDGYEVHLD